MKGTAKVILFLITITLSLTPAVYADKDERYVILINGDRVYVDMGYMDGVREGMRFEVYRIISGLRVGVAQCEVERVYDYASKLKLINTVKGEKIQIGDMAEVVPIREAAVLIPQAKPEEGKPEAQRREKAYRSISTRWWAYGGGLLLASMALYFNHAANVQYEGYLSARYPEDVVRYRRAYEREVTKARISAMLAGAIVVGYLFKSRVLSPHAQVSGLITSGDNGDLSVGIRIGGIGWFGERSRF